MAHTAVWLQAFICYGLVLLGEFPKLGGGLCEQTPPGEFVHKGGSPARRLAPTLSILSVNVLVFSCHCTAVWLQAFIFFSLVRFCLFPIKGSGQCGSIWFVMSSY